MDWNLRKSRGRFFDETGEDRGRCFWVSEMERWADGGAAPRPMPGRIADWDPSAAESRSNCPELHERVLQLREVVDERWLARVRNIYAGRTTESRDTALCTYDGKGGAIIVSVGYSMSVVAYVVAFAHFCEALALQSKAGVLAARPSFSKARTDLDEVIGNYTALGPAAFLERNRAYRVPPAMGRAVNTYTDCNEAWVLTHEVSHAVLRHLSSKPDRDAQARVKEVMGRPAIACEIETLDREQREEIEADVLAYLILSGEIVGRQSSVQAITALFGAVFSLLAVAHSRDEWATEAGSKHPGCLTRIAVVVKVAAMQDGHRTMSDQNGRAGEKLYQTAAFLCAFVAWIGALPLEDNLIEADSPDEGVGVLARNVLLALELSVLQDQDQARRHRWAPLFPVS